MRVVSQNPYSGLCIDNVRNTRQWVEPPFIIFLVFSVYDDWLISVVVVVVQYALGWIILFKIWRTSDSTHNSFFHQREVNIQILYATNCRVRMSYALLNILKRPQRKTQWVRSNWVTGTPHLADFLNPIIYLWVNNKQSNYQKPYKIKTDKIFKRQKIK